MTWTMRNPRAVLLAASISSPYDQGAVLGALPCPALGVTPNRAERLPAYFNHTKTLCHPLV